MLTRLGQGRAEKKQTRYANRIARKKRVKVDRGGASGLAVCKSRPGYFPGGLCVLLSHPLPLAKFPQISARSGGAEMRRAGVVGWLWTLLKMVVVVKGQGVAQTQKKKKKRADF